MDTDISLSVNIAEKCFDVQWMSTGWITMRNVSFYDILKPCSHRTSALTLLNQSRSHLNFDASVNADADAWCEWCNWNQCIPFTRQSNASFNGKVDADVRCESAPKWQLVRLSEWVTSYLCVIVLCVISRLGPFTGQIMLPWPRI